MLAVLSPAKSLNYHTVFALAIPPSDPLFLEDANNIVLSVLKSKNSGDFKKLMKLSDDLSKRTFAEYQSYEASNDFTVNKVKMTMAGLLFDGPAYRALDCKTLSPVELNEGCKYIRFLSGLYGILRPNDMIQNHRLEMSTNLQIGTCANLYEYWGEKLVTHIKNHAEYYNSNLCTSSQQITNKIIFLLLNIASEEYFKVFSLKHLYSADEVSTYSTRTSNTDKSEQSIKQCNIKIVDCVFQDKGKIVSVYAKHARGLMARYICTNTKLHSLLNSSKDGAFVDVFEIIEILKQFNMEGYEFDSKNSEILPDIQRSKLSFNRIIVPSKTAISKEKTIVVDETNKLTSKRKRTK